MTAQEAVEKNGGKLTHHPNHDIYGDVWELQKPAQAGCAVIHWLKEDPKTDIWERAAKAMGIGWRAGK